MGTNCCVTSDVYLPGSGGGPQIKRDSSHKKDKIERRERNEVIDDSQDEV